MGVLQGCGEVDSLPLVSQIWQSQRGSKIAVKGGQWSVRRQINTDISKGVEGLRRWPDRRRSIRISSRGSKASVDGRLAVVGRIRVSSRGSKGSV